jgi:hypothetical protein
VGRKPDDVRFRGVRLRCAVFGECAESRRRTGNRPSASSAYRGRNINDFLHMPVHELTVHERVSSPTLSPLVINVKVMEVWRATRAPRIIIAVLSVAYASCCVIKNKYWLCKFLAYRFEPR